MADVFGIFSAAVGVAAAAGQVIDGIMKLHSFCSQIRNIPEDIKTAVNNLATMVELLEFVQDEMNHEFSPSQPSHLSSSMKVLSNLEQSSQQVGEVLEEMRNKLGKKKYWGRIKAVGMIKRLETAAKRVENAQCMLLILLAAENRMTFRQSLNAQRRELTALSTHILSVSSAGQFTRKISAGTRAINDIESRKTTDEDPDSAGTAPHQPIQRISKPKGRNTAVMRLRLPNLFLNPVWEFSVYKANQGWDFSFRSYNIRPWKAPIFEAIRNGNLSQVRELLHSGRASIWDRDPSYSGVLHHAALACGNHGSAVLKYLVKIGADIYDVDIEGSPPFFYLSPNYYVNRGDEQMEHHLVAGYKVFTNHEDWIPPRPSMFAPLMDSQTTETAIDLFPIFRNPPEEIIYSVLHEMWPPWKDMRPADRMKALFPDYDSSFTSIMINPLSIRACLSREDIQETFANWDTRDKVNLIKYAFGALAEQLADGSEKGIEEARIFLKDMHITNSLVSMLPDVDSLYYFIWKYATILNFPASDRWTLDQHENALQEGLKRYISEMMLLGIDMATVIDIERKLRARQTESFPRTTYWRNEEYDVIFINHGLKGDDWRLWLSNPHDEWAGEFWDMIDHPERAIPGAWNEDE